ncbi:MAG: PAS domain-containing sensor histidine kinase [Alphaproteobacteria bacterium]|nr:PAS domain-containing sensor histidine kinase [Alphaproteobacteria bacterium]
MTVLSIIQNSVDALLHPSARRNALTRARHRAFIAPRLLGSLAVFATFPIYLVMRGAPSALEVVVFAGLMSPIVVSWYLSHTGRFEYAHMLSSLALASVIVAVAATSGGIESFAAVWLLVIPLEAALSASRRVVGFAAALALCCAVLLVVLGYFDLLPPMANATDHRILMAAGVISAMLYAAGLAFGAESLSRTSMALLLREEERYRLLARNMSDVISRHGGNGAVLFISPVAEDLLGTEVSTLLGHGLFERVHVADRPVYLTALSDAACGRQRCVRFRARRDSLSGGRFIWIEMRCNPLAAAGEGADDRQVVAVLRDISARKVEEDALSEAHSAAEAAQATRTRFLAAMSHELRTPLNAIIGFSEMLVQEQTLQLEPARRQEYAGLIADSGRHLLSVVNGILDMARLEAGSFEIVPEPFSPRGALVQCCNLLALKAREGDIDLVTDAPRDLPMVNADARAFKQIVLNLISNAIKFTGRGGQVAVVAEATDVELVVRIRDTGVGIAPDDLKRIGAPFFQVGNVYQRRHEGTGLGLSIVKSLVALHHGELNVSSEVGAGTTVTVKLPLVWDETHGGCTVTALVPVAGSREQPALVKKRA